jgi:hypothetical protein
LPPRPRTVIRRRLNTSPLVSMRRNPRRAHDAEGREIEPMSLANMREHGVRFVEATCEDCKHEAVVNVDSLPDAVYVPDVALRLRCSACGSKKITTRPDWTHHAAHGRGGYTTARNPGC